MKHILYIITRAELGGAQIHLLSLAKNLKNTYHITILCGETGFLSEQANRLGISFIHCPSLSWSIHPIRDTMAVWHIYQHIQNLKPDFIHLHSSKAGIIGRISAKLAHTAVIFTAHGWAFTDGVSKKRQWLFSKIELYLQNLLDKIICVSEYDYNKAVSIGIKKQKMVAIHNGSPDTSLLAQHANKPTITITMTARFSVPKDQASLILASAHLSGIQLWFLGEGEYMKNCQELAHTHQIPATFWGNQDDIPKFLSQSDIFVLASNYEGLPLSIIEAMRAGLPIIASDVGGIPELVRHGINGYLVPQGNIEALHHAINKLTQDASLRAYMGQMSRLIYLEHFSEPAMLEKTIEVYSSLQEHK